MVWGSYHSGGESRSPSVSQRKEVMIRIMAGLRLTKQVSIPYMKEKCTSPRRRFFIGIKFFPDKDSPGFMETVCREARTSLGKDCKALGEAAKGSQSQVSFAHEPGCGVPHLQPLLQRKELHLLEWAFRQPCVSWRVWFAQLTGLLTLQVYVCKPPTSICSSSLVRFLGV